MQTRPPTEELLDLTADIMGCDRHTLRVGAAGSPFVTLGGSLAQAMRLQARADEQLGLAVDLAWLMGPAPLEEALARAVPATATTLRTGPGRAVREPLPEQRALLTAEEYTGGAAVHRVLSAELTGPLDSAALRRALRALVSRHDGLRTVFVWSPKGPVRRVPVRGEAHLTVEEAPPATGDPVAAAHARIGESADRLLGSPDRPPFAFVLTRLGDDRHLLSFVFHDAVADAWSAALVWRELLTDYERARTGRPVTESPSPSPDAALDRSVELAASGTVLTLATRRIAQLREYPTVVRLPAAAPRPGTFDFRGARLLFDLEPGVRERVEAVAARAGVPHAVVLLAAWALTAGRAAGLDRLLVGTEVPRRPTGALMRTVAPCSATVPVRCELHGPVDYFLRGMACAFSEALEYADVAPRALSQGLGIRPDRSRTPLTQITFAAHDELLPEVIEAGGLTARFHPGHCGGAGADAGLSVLRWGERPLLGLEYASSVFTEEEAATLARRLRRTLDALLAADPETFVEDTTAQDTARAVPAPLT
ncbi:condensation domain-containing protein [Streptomyces sp. NPDC001595]|uniref:condensation domain-containing protein n=1 Tax=Streptomyces sp. NPDC001532 TaxID=3154520 RepID=UPI00331EFC67